MSTGPGPDESGSPTQPTVDRSQRFAHVLNLLFATRLTEENGRKRPYKLREVAEGTGISIGYLSEARRGNIADPHMQKVTALARFFNVSPTIFLSDEPFVPEMSEQAAAMEAVLHEALVEPNMGKLMLRAGSYSPVERSMILEVMDTIVEQWRAMDARRADNAGSHAQESVPRRGHLVLRRRPRKG